jgi:phosphoenolpyruvate synthase/pyruvate phosphate dikinase
MYWKILELKSEKKKRNNLGNLCYIQDIEFTVQENRLWMLQCRSGKRTGKGAVKIAVDMVSEGLVDIRSAIKMVEPQHLDQLLHPQVNMHLYSAHTHTHTHTHIYIYIYILIIFTRVSFTHANG